MDRLLLQSKTARIAEIAVREAIEKTETGDAVEIVARIINSDRVKGIFEA